MSDDESLEQDIERYATMPEEEVDRELREAGIDPQPTIDAVRALVEKTLKRAPSSNPPS
jgi:hypothetical protein